MDGYHTTEISPSASNVEFGSSARGPRSLHLPQNLVCLVLTFAFLTTLVILAVHMWEKKTTKQNIIILVCLS